MSGAGLGPFYGPGTAKGVGFHESQTKAEAFDPAGAKKLAERSESLKKEAAELVKVVASGDQEAVKAQFGTLTKTCKSCHDEYRVKP